MSEHTKEEFLNFLKSQLQRIEKEVEKMDLPIIQYPHLVPVDNGKYVGKVYLDVTEGKIGYGFTMQDVVRAKDTGINLDSTRAMDARRTAEMLIQEIVFNGYKEKNWTGLFNDTNVTALNAAEGKSGNTWKMKADCEIIKDINDLLCGAREGWSMTFLADTLLLPLTAFSRLSRIEKHGKTSFLLQHIKRANIYTLQTGQDLTIRARPELEHAADSNGGRAVAYQCAPDLLKLHLPKPHHFLDFGGEDPLYVHRWGKFCTGGLEIIQPAAVRYLDQIT